MLAVLPMMDLPTLPGKTLSVEIKAFVLTHTPVEPLLPHLLTTMVVEPTSAEMPTITATRMAHASLAQPTLFAMPMMEDPFLTNQDVTNSLAHVLDVLPMLTALQLQPTVVAMDFATIADNSLPTNSVGLDLMVLLPLPVLTPTAILSLVSV